MVYSWKYGSHLEKWVALENVSDLEKYATHNNNNYNNINNNNNNSNNSNNNNNNNNICNAQIPNVQMRMTRLKAE